MEAQEKGKARAAPPRPAARDLLLDAASAVMSERQTIDVPLADIAARAEVNVALVTTFFAEPLARTAKELMEAGIADGTIRPMDPTLFYMAALGACEQIFANRSILKFVHGVDGIDEALMRRYSDVVLEVLTRGYLEPNAK